MTKTDIPIELERVAMFIWRLGDHDPTDDIDMQALIADARSYREDLKDLADIFRKQNELAAPVWPDNLTPCS